MRIREYSDSIPKPMVPVGYRPMLWNIMRYYAHFGHKEFILCLGYRADVIKEYFLNYNEYVSNDFVMHGGGQHRQLLTSDIQDWRITFVDTGLTANIGQRLMRVREYLGDDEIFLANYSDALTDLNMNAMIEHHQRKGVIASFMAYRSTQSFHIVRLGDDELVTHISPIADSGMLINCGYFVLNNTIFDYIEEGEELVEQPFRRLIAERQLSAYPYQGFWTAMDTFKDKQLFDDMVNRGNKPWEVWRPKETGFSSKSILNRV